MAYEGVPGPRVVAYNLASQTYDYMMRALSLGAFEGDIGHMKPIPQVMSVLEALHTVLAGGEVDIKTSHRGNPDLFNELNTRFREALVEANEINKKAGYYFTIAG